MEHTPLRPAVVRDPVHGYITIAVHERLVVDHAVTQRLRRVNQNGLTEYVYPQATTSRFIHSLGAMHLASKFVLACLENADDDVADRFFKEVEKLPLWSSYIVDIEELDKLLAKQGVLSALSAVRASFHQKSLKNDQQRCRRLLALVEAGLRLAALFHDLGHLPFSHDFEYALKDYASAQRSSGKAISDPLKQMISKSAPHEEVGHQLAHLVFKSLVPHCSAEIRAAFDMARLILETPSPGYDMVHNPKADICGWLHSLIDGEVDSDRADYLLRDGQTLGLDFVHFDLELLVQNLVLLHDDRLGYITAVREHGLSALESFSLARYREGQGFIRHHKVVQCASALRYCSVELFKSGKVQAFLDLLGGMGNTTGGAVEAAKLLKSFAGFDDGWWIESLRAFRTNASDELLVASLALVLDRAPVFRSVWKRKGELTQAQREALNMKVSASFTDAGKIDFADRRRELLKRKVLIATHKFRPFAERPDGKSVMLIKPNGVPVPASEMSPLISKLKDAWGQEVHLHAFTTDPSVTVEEVLKILTG